ncbi:hypothetical protein FHG87_016886 [Trinorchestia longiramus]|nr:hypothetical protein FHG87_016886 [Trinorchestia longiramus]
MYSTSGSSQHTSSHAGSSKGSHGGAASKCCAARGAGQDECVGVSRPPPLRTYSRVRTGGSCGNLSRSSFDTQPPGRGKRNRRNKGADPASTSTREGGSLQNLSKAEGCGEEDQKGLQKSGSLSEVFTEETTPPKHKSRRRKASSETQQSHQRASEERCLGAPDSFSSDDEDEGDSNYPPYRPLSPHHSPVMVRSDTASVLPAAAGGGISSEQSGCASRASSISSHDEPMSVQVEEMRRCAFTTTAAATAAADGAGVDAASAAACLGAAVSGRPAHQDQGEELVEVVSHTAHRDTVKPSWLQSSSPSNSRSMGGRRRSTSPHSVSAAVDSQVPFFSRSSSDRHADSMGKNSYGRSHSIESNAYSSKSTDERGSEREKLQSQRSEPSQVSNDILQHRDDGVRVELGRRKDSAIDCPSPPSHSYSTSGSPQCTFSVSGGAGSSLIVSPGEHRDRDHGNGRTLRFKPGRVKKKRQQEVQTVDTSAPSYKGDQDIGSILLYLGEESVDVSAGDSKKKKKKQDAAPNKKEDKKESGKKGTSAETASKKADEGKDDHKKEDSGGGGVTNEKRKKHKEDRKNSTPITEEDELGVKKMKKEVIEKELKKNGIITPSSLDSSVGTVGSGGDCNKSSLDGNSLDCDNTSSVRTNVESSKTLTSVSDKESKTSVRKHPDDKAGSETSNRSSSKKNDDRKQNASVANSEAPVSKRSKKSGKENQGIRASSSVEDLVSKCRMSEQMSQGSKQTTVDDEAMMKERQRKNSRRNAAENGLPATTSSSSTTNTNTTTTFRDSNTKDKHRRTVDDIRVKSASGASKSSGGSSSLSNSKKLSKRLSSSNSNLNSSAKSSEFGRDFYEAGDPYIESLPLKDSAVSDTNDEFELVTRRKNRNKKFSPTSGNGSLILGTGKLRYAEENFSRDGYRDPAHQKNTSGRIHHSSGSSSSNSQTKTIGGGSSHANPSSYPPHSTDTYPSKGTCGGKKPPINFDEAPRTPHDSNFMARLSANNSGDRNTATSAPNSDCSDSDGDDSVHSMPTPSTTPRPEVRKPPSSSGATPQTSYANIARLAGTANRNQVKRMTSAPQPRRTAAAASTSTTDTSSNSTSGGYSAAACATSDQSLLTTNAWPCLSSVGGTAATVANSGAATSAPAIPSILWWASGSSNRQGDPQYVAPAFGSPPRLTSAAIAAHDAKPQNILRDNFPPLKSPSYPCTFNHRQASNDSDTGLPHHVEACGKLDDVTVRMSADSRSGAAGTGRASFSSEKESSPVADKNLVKPHETTSPDLCTCLVTNFFETFSDIFTSTTDSRLFGFA